MAEPDRMRGTPRAREGRVDLLACDFTVANLIGLRHEVERHARSSGLAALALHRYVVAVNEVTTNAVRHGGGAGRLHLWRDRDELRCRVTDRGAPVCLSPTNPATPIRSTSAAVDSGSSSRASTISPSTAGRAAPP